MLDFRPLQLEDHENYTKLFAACQEKYAEYSFFALWGWHDTDPVELLWEEGLCWIRSHGHREGLLAPVGDWSAVDWTQALPGHMMKGETMLDVPKALLDLMPPELRDTLEITPLRDEWEYIHAVADLIELKGNKYSAKRSHVKAFTYDYEWEYLPLLPDDFNELREFQAEWGRRHNESSTPLLYAEEHAIEYALEMWEQIPFLGGALRVDGHMIAYTIGEELSPDTIDIRFEKGFSDFNGIYQAINKMFLERQCKAYTWVNREEDMGSEGLRHAKMSYHPARFAEKYAVKLK